MSLMYGAHGIRVVASYTEDNMLRKSKPEDDFAVFHTLIGPKTTIEGRINFSDGVRIDGHVVGDIQVEREAVGSIAVGPGGEVRGNITAHRVLIAGAVFGNIRALEMAHLLSTARITGDVSYAKLSICSGAVINGALCELAKGEETSEGPKLLRLADKTHDNASAAGS
jgi:cytoskeletal protein CcmA (bactofilin family)